MKVIKTVKNMQQYMKNVSNEKIGFVPTMGYFHEGHLALMEEAKKENDIVVTSVFVNPLQFGPNEDYDRYPRNENRDMELAEKVGVDILFMPSKQEMYPREMAISLKIQKRTNVLCGRSRPGHFDGVITVLTKLFHIVQPDHVYFGMKDAQQVAVVEALINDLNFPIKLIGIPTVREKDGLAKSSRNVNLTDKERKEANGIYKALQYGQQLIQNGEKNPSTIVNEVKNMIKKHTSGTIDYVDILSYPNLKQIQSIEQQTLLAVAVYFKHARLIDNMLIDKNGTIIDRFY